MTKKNFSYLVTLTIFMTCKYRYDTIMAVWLLEIVDTSDCKYFPQTWVLFLFTPTHVRLKNIAFPIRQYSSRIIPHSHPQFILWKSLPYYRSILRNISVSCAQQLFMHAAQSTCCSRACVQESHSSATPGNVVGFLRSKTMRTCQGGYVIEMKKCRFRTIK